MLFSKSSFALAVASTLMAVANADMLQISNPTQGTTWKVGGDNVFLQWSGNCASMGPLAKNVDVNLMTGASSALRFVTKLASIDCSGSNSRKEFTIPADLKLASGQYSLSVLTSPVVSYSNIFTIDAGATDGSSPASGSDSGNSTSVGAAGTGAGAGTQGSGASSVTAGMMVAVAAVVMASQLI